MPHGGRPDTRRSAGQTARAASAIVDTFRKGQRTTVYALAMGAAILPISAFVAQDL